MKKIMRPTLLLFCAYLGLITTLKAEVRLAGIFSSNMVLQRNQDIVFWGWADKGERISVSFNELTKKTKADTSGKWKVVFPKMQAGGPYHLNVQGKNQIGRAHV